MTNVNWRPSSHSRMTNVNWRPSSHLRMTNVNWRPSVRWGWPMFTEGLAVIQGWPMFTDVQKIVKGWEHPRKEKHRCNLHLTFTSLSPTSDGSLEYHWRLCNQISPYFPVTAMQYRPLIPICFWQELPTLIAHQVFFSPIDYHNYVFMLVRPKDLQLPTKTLTGMSVENNVPCEMNETFWYNVADHCNATAHLIMSAPAAAAG